MSTWQVALGLWKLLGWPWPVYFIGYLLSPPRVKRQTQRDIRDDLRLLNLFEETK